MCGTGSGSGNGNWSSRPKGKHLYVRKYADMWYVYKFLDDATLLWIFVVVMGKKKEDGGWEMAWDWVMWDSRPVYQSRQLSIIQQRCNQHRKTRGTETAAENETGWTTKRKHSPMAQRRRQGNAPSTWSFGADTTVTTIVVHCYDYGAPLPPL